MELKHRKPPLPVQEPVPEPEEKKTLVNLNAYYKISFAVCSILAVITRAWMINHPGEVVFDEVHFGKFASYYLRREYYFDVHPPLGKLLLALVGWIVNYDGHFLFTKIGMNYSENNVPYIAFRLFCAMCGAGVVPIAFLILQELGVSVIGCTVGALFLVFDNSLVTQSRLILLDSMLMLFCIASIYFWIRFYKERFNPFSFDWWFWLLMTGVGLAATTGVKMVGLFTVATVGIATLVDLWDLWDIKRKVAGRTFFYHFSARVFGLILVPLFFYVLPFYIHFEILTKSGPGDAFMSIKFQETLLNNKVSGNATRVPVDSVITLRHVDTKAHLHSHLHKIPLKHASGRISSNGQQVNGYAHSDENSKWNLELVDPAKFQWDMQPLTEMEKSRGLRYLRNGDLIHFRHITTDSYLKTHDVASPLTSTNMEVITITKNDTAYETKYEETIWKVEIGAKDQTGNLSRIISSRSDTVRFRSNKYGVYLYTHSSPLPEWGYKMQEINGEKKDDKPGILWTFQDIDHDRLVDGVDPDDPVVEKSSAKHPFWKKLVELQLKMIHHNAALTQSHPYSSAPISWPFVVRGISFWEKKDGFKQIYLLGNPFIWWLSLGAMGVFVALWSVDRIMLRRGVDDFGMNVRKWWDKSIGFLLVAWALHWLPFFLMGRMLFLHHYLPAFIISVICATTFIDYIGRMNLNYCSASVPVKRIRWMVSQGGVTYHVVMVILVAVAVGVFVFFSPLTYGTGFAEKQVLRQRKWLKSWDMQYSSL